MTKTSVKKPCFSLKRVFPPYAKFAIFFACGLEVFYHAFVMAINQKFFEISSKIFPVAFQMFNDTDKRGGVVFEDGTPYRWSDVELAKLNLYQTKLILMWFISTCTILYSMLCVVPQFCEMEESSGKNRTWCMKKPILGYVMAPVLVVLIFLCGIILTWQWATCQSDADLFHKLFRHALKEEKYLSVIERELNCHTDDDKEVVDLNWAPGDNSAIESTLPVRGCNMLVEASMPTQSWLDPLYFTFIFYHLLILVLFGYLNNEKLCGKQNDEDESTRGADVESATRLI
ncbi:hypothetical protein FO519_004552 [Halicephalobus sp. NKZ332]|nr:hypothetical protein FO519_004552 [Halicephalobus sp. NKZ332]